MSDTPLAALTQENQSLKDQLKNLIDQSNGYNAQLDVHKKMLSEYITNVLNLTAQLNVNNRESQVLHQKVSDLQKLNDELVTQINQLKGQLNAPDQVSE